MKLLRIPGLVLVACLMAGLYGALHNQISYTVSPEYFTRFKFEQFHILMGTPQRLGAAIVGWGAAWWMGVIISAVLLPVSRRCWQEPDYVARVLRAYWAVTGTALLCGMLALLAGYALLDADNAGEFRPYGNEIQDHVAFARAGLMHNCSYLGGVLGIAAGVVVLKRTKSPPIAAS
jgi:hypothetical protein